MKGAAWRIRDERKGQPGTEDASRFADEHERARDV